MKIKITFLIIIITFFKYNVHAQSKKDQIENMTMKLDSLGQIIISKTQNIVSLNDMILLKEKCIDSTANYVSNLNKEFGELKENSKTSNQHYEIQLKELNLSIVKLHDSLAAIINTPTVKIGNQEWMSSDINTIIYNNGDSIKEAKTGDQWKKYNDLKVGCYRRLSIGTYVYNTFAKEDKRGILPPNFSLPTYEQFQQLMIFLGGGDSKDGNATKSLASYDLFFQEKTKDQTTGFFTLKDIKVETDGSSGFKAVEGGYVNESGYNEQGNCSFWWTTSTGKPENLYIRIGACINDDAFSYIDVNSYTKCGFAIRAIRK